jgi:O-antigen ligase
MKRRSAPKPAVHPEVDPRARLAAIGRGVLFAHLLLTPLLFTQCTIEHFEFVKFLGLIATALVLLALGALALPHVNWRQLRSELRQPLPLAGLAFVTSTLLSTLASTDWRTSLFGHHENHTGFITILAYWLLFVATLVLIRTRQQIHQLLVAIAIAATGITIYGLLQAAQLDPLIWFDPSKVGSYVRPFASFGHANFLGAWLVLALPLVMFLASGRWRFAILALAAAMGLLLLLTMSRGAWLGAGCAVVIALILRPRGRFAIQRRTLIVVSIGLGFTFGVVCMVSESFREAIASRAKGFFDGEGRMETWVAAGGMFFERPVLGAGPDTFHHHFGRHSGGKFWEHSWGFTPARAHNEFLHVAATQGIVGILALLGVLGAIVWGLQRAWRHHPEQRGLLVAIAAALGGFFITEMVGFTVIPCGSLAVVLCGVTARLAFVPSAETATCLAHRTTIPVRCAQAGLLGVLAYSLFFLVVDPLRADLNSAAGAAAQSPSAAMRFHQEAVRLCPRSPLYLSRFAAFIEEQGRCEHHAALREQRYRLAHDAFAKAAQCEPGNGYHRNGLGRATAELAKLGKADPQSAYAAFDQALIRDPSIAYFYVDASQAALQLGDAARATTYIRAGIERYPDYGAMRKQAALLLLFHNRPREAIPEFDRALAADWKGEMREWQITAEIRAEVIQRISYYPPNHVTE